ncbi:PRAME family member 18-like [Apodemus sylvaticus]|uniref:PRAME family member 18-like n=1 Tax=Apodemus sylvaticus TaxID=10129 RepID=UPI0022442EE6|nr:PRAME family member 18-like [Apodemus sylvaticus]
MSTYNPLTLQQLALDVLLRKDAINSSDLDHLPTVLFPPLFLEAFNGRHTQILKAMVAAWPFPCLPVGALMKTTDVEVLQAVLEGIDILQTQNASPSRKLQVLDLRDVHQDFWDVWAGRKDEVCSAKTGNEKQVAKHTPRYALRQRLKFSKLNYLQHLSMNCGYFSSENKKLLFRGGGCVASLGTLVGPDVSLPKVGSMKSAFRNVRRLSRAENNLNPWHLQCITILDQTCQGFLLAFWSTPSRTRAPAELHLCSPGRA